MYRRCTCPQIGLALSLQLPEFCMVSWNFMYYSTCTVLAALVYSCTSTTCLLVFRALIRWAIWRRRRVWVGTRDDGLHSRARASPLTKEWVVDTPANSVINLLLLLTQEREEIDEIDLRKVTELKVPDPGGNYEQQCTFTIFLADKWVGSCFCVYSKIAISKIICVCVGWFSQ